MSADRAPSRLARAGIAVATAVLPSGDARERYRAEFSAELSTLNAVAQLAFTGCTGRAPAAASTAGRSGSVP